MHHDAKVAKVIYEEALLAVEFQNSNLDSYRSRSLFGLTVTGAIASLLTVSESHRGWAFWAALCAVLVGVLLVGSVLRPREWRVNPASRGWEQLLGTSHDESSAYTQLAVWHQQNVDDNEAEVESVWRSYVLSALVFSVAIGLLFVNATEPPDGVSNEPVRVVIVQNE